MRPRLSSGLALAILLGPLACPRDAHPAVNDMLPTDYVTLPGGYTTVTAYAFARRLEGPYADGKRVAPLEIDAQILAIRISHFLEGTAWPTALTAIVPAARAELDNPVPPGFNRAASGFADPRFSLTVWPISDPDHTHFLGVSAMVLPPLGNYHQDDALNIGDNRWQAVLLMGWTRALNERWLVDVSPEIAWYGDNRRALGHHRLSQETSYALTGYLRYRLDANHQLMLGAQWNGGGETALDGADRDDAPRNRKLYAGWMGTLGPNTQGIVRYGRDVAVDNGFRIDDELMLRLLWWFR